MVPREFLKPPPRHYQAPEVKLINGEAVRYSDICVHEFKLSDVDDPDIYVSEPIWRWQQTEAGAWVMQNAVEEPYYVQYNDHWTWGYHYKIMARLSEANQTFWHLKWGIKP